MTDEQKPRTDEASKQSIPSRRRNRDSERMDDKSGGEGSTDAPMDPEDESFIESK